MVRVKKRVKKRLDQRKNKKSVFKKNKKEESNLELLAEEEKLEEVSNKVVSEEKDSEIDQNLDLSFEGFIEDVGSSLVLERIVGKNSSPVIIPSKRGFKEDENKEEKIENYDLMSSDKKSEEKYLFQEDIKKYFSAPKVFEKTERRNDSRDINFVQSELEKREKIIQEYIPKTPERIKEKRNPSFNKELREISSPKYEIQ